MVSVFSTPRSAALCASALGAVAALGLTVAATPAQSATFDDFQFIFEADAPGAPSNDCSGAFGTSSACEYVSADNYYFDGPGAMAGGQPGVPLTTAGYTSFNHGTLFQIGKINFEFDDEGLVCCSAVTEVESDFFGKDNSPFTFSSPGGVQTWTYDPTAHGLNLPWMVFAFTVKGGPSNFNVWEVTNDDAPTFSLSSSPSRASSPRTDRRANRAACHTSPSTARTTCRRSRCRRPAGCCCRASAGWR